MHDAKNVIDVMDVQENMDYVTSYHPKQTQR